ncbi:alpha/beta hydrolase [Prevotella sp. 10(H)]|uniref:alpha/beta hydrolase n=1 Tax=Prevotella sp. 10(H) TaxID=1158294 RepID=UPI0004A6B498|nr:alpha/beta hydrolase [Prevotella sp. 10(H)]
MTTQLYTADILGNGFEQRTLPLKNDYEGETVATLVRRLAEDKAQKAVFYVHGFNDYFFQAEMAEQFNVNGFNFYAVDLRKYGRSHLPNQKLNDIRNLKDYYEEILLSLNIIRTEGNNEIVLLGHSTGGLILTLFAKDHADSNLFDALILNSPFFDFNQSKLEKFFIPIAAFFGRLMPNVTIAGGFSEEYGKSIHKSYRGEWNYDLKWKPNVAPKINLGWLRAIHLGQKQLRKVFHIPRPILVLHSAHSVDNMKDEKQVSTRDAILNVKDIDRIARNINGKVQISTIDGGLHDLMLSGKSVRKNVYDTIFGWLKKKRL